MKNLKILISGWLICLPLFVFAQEDPFKDLMPDSTPIKEYVKAAFKSTRVINSQSIENVHGGVLDFRISHRFGPVNGGTYEFFGLDQASMRIGLEYGITNRLEAGIGRNSTNKIYDGFVKYKALWQATGPKASPISLVYFGSTAITSLHFSDTSRENLFSSRLAYTHQLLIGRKFSDKFTFQLMPTLVHRNLTDSIRNPNDIYALGGAMRYKLTRSLSLNAEYFYRFLNKDAMDYYNDPQHPGYNSLSIGIDIETGGHVFQLQFTNSLQMIEKGFIAETKEKWGNGGIHFGFNISRVFTLKS